MLVVAGALKRGDRKRPEEQVRGVGRGGSCRNSVSSGWGWDNEVQLGGQGWNNQVQ